MISETTKQIAFRVWIRRILAAILVVSYVPLALGLIQVAVVPSKYLFVVLPFYGLLVAGIVWVLLRSRALGVHAWRLVVVGIVAIVLSVTNLYAYSVVRATDGLLSGIQDARSTYVEYVIIAKKGHEVKVSEASSVGVVANDPLREQAAQALALETPAGQRSYDSLTAAAESLRTGEVELASVRQASLQLISENYRELYQEIVVLATYRVKVDVQAPTQADVSKPFVLYISGIDTYGEVSKVSRSDVNMLVVVNPRTRQILLVNTPRDYYVQLHGTTGSRDKLTHAGIYGVDMSRQTLEDLYGAQVSYYARINFTSLVKIIDTVGPIDVYSDYSFKSYHEGYNTLDSKQALEFARERYSFNEGDRQRGRNQQRVIEAIIAKMNKPQNAVHSNAVIGAVKGSMETNMSESSIKQLVRTQLDDLKAWGVESISVDGTGSMQPTYSMGAQPLYVMEPDDFSLAEARQRIADTLAR